MTIEIRQKFGTGERALEFMLAHPFGTEQEERVTLSLKEALAAGTELLAQVLVGEAGAKAAAAARRESMRAITRELLRPLARVAVVATAEEPALARLHRAPSVKHSLQDFRVAAEGMLEGATTHREVLLRHGLPPTLVDDLAAALATFDAQTQQAHAGRRAHIGARAELDALGSRVMALLQQLDGMNTYRLRHDPERAAAWQSARKVPWRSAPAGPKEPPADAAQAGAR